MGWLWGNRGRRTPGADEVARKALAWNAFANLFLDTELQVDDLARIAARLRETGIPYDELRQILDDEVAPALAANLFLDIAGEWSSFASEYVIERVIECMAEGPPVLLPMGLVRKYCGAEWKKLEPLLIDPTS